MSNKSNTCMKMQIVSPLNGKVVPLEEVPDPVFSEKILGDGIAVIPTDGKIVSPVDGEVISVADTLHAYGFAAEDGMEILVHFGLETVSLNGEVFKSHVKVGDKVKKGDLIAEADIAGIQAKGLQIITPVLICGGLEEKILGYGTGDVKAGKTTVLTISPKCEEVVETVAETVVPEKTEKKKFKFNFDFLQKLGKVLMAVIAVMPAAGLMISVGKLVQMAGVDMSVVMTIGSTMENIGWAIINNLHILFAVAIGGSWAKERAGGAFAAAIAFILINVITGAAFGVTSEIINFCYFYRIICCIC